MTSPEPRTPRAISLTFLLSYSFSILLAPLEVGCMAEHASPGQASIVINEFLPAPNNLSEGEWVELHNTGNSTVGLGGWILDDIADGGSRPFVIPGGTCISPGGFLLLKNATTRIGLNDGGDTVRLVDPQGNTVDNYSYSHSQRGFSRARIPDGSCNWIQTGHHTPNRTNNPPETPALYAPLITQVCYHAFPGCNDEFAAITNPGPENISLDDWHLRDYGSSAAFPENTTLRPGNTIYITGNASGFLADMGFVPDFETSGSRADVMEMTVYGQWPALGNDGGQLFLEDPGGIIVDAFIWGVNYTGRGWEGPPALLLGPGYVARRAIEYPPVFYDTNSSSDWPARNALLMGRTNNGCPAFMVNEITAFLSPDCSFDTIARAIQDAGGTIFISLYQFESAPLARLLAAACARGVTVSVLMEGAPVGGLTNQSRAIARLLHDAGASVSFACRGDSRVPDRYSFLHAKYCVVDNSSVIVSSENWKPTGIPSNSTYGNRGWGALVRSVPLADFFTRVFENDSNPRMRDIHPFSLTDQKFGPPPVEYALNESVPLGNFSPVFDAETFPGGTVSPVLSPDSSLLGNLSVLGLIRCATRTLYIEQFSCAPNWNGPGNCSNLYLDAVMDAARRGVDVKILLDLTYADSEDGAGGNADVVNHLNYLALKERLRLEARGARISGVVKLHNKGLVVDGEKALVSSINWGPTSVMENREAGLIISHRGVAGYFEKCFLSDFNSTVSFGKISQTPARPGNGQTAHSPCLAPVAAIPILAVLIVLIRKTCPLHAHHEPEHIPETGGQSQYQQ